LYKKMVKGYALINDLIIRPARPCDAHDFVRTWDEVSREGIYLLHDRAPRTVVEQEKIISYLNWDRNTIVVARLEGEIVGGMCIFAGGSSPKSTSFCNLGVHIVKRARGQGIGKRLLKYGIDWARTKGYHKVCLSVFSTNTRAIKLYEKLGFVYEGLRKEQYKVKGQWVDELLMSKFL